MNRTLSVCISVLVGTFACNAQMRKSAVAPPVAAEGARRLVSEIKWQGMDGNDLGAQRELTREATAKGKLIFYMHMLGNIAGNT